MLNTIYKLTELETIAYVEGSKSLANKQLNDLLYSTTMDKTELCKLVLTKLHKPSLLSVFTIYTNTHGIIVDYTSTTSSQYVAINLQQHIHSKYLSPADRQFLYVLNSSYAISIKDLFICNLITPNPKLTSYRLRVYKIAKKILTHEAKTQNSKLLLSYINKVIKLNKEGTKWLKL